ncbi:uncharacterized protein OCT59_005858 [Rhizophagus irregularis]|uniref:uncharacterized protein n=1 Tax=Rhizophagus irregularis TaxID=588596 RepID=UPI00332A184B|nr:hypothetical protein OCT59_005858 [Rhizophagus irregularis]
MEQKRIPNKEVALKYLSNSQNNDINNEFLNEIKSYFAEYDKIIKIYGISQSPATNDYIIFNNIKALHESNSAIFVNGPLCYNYDKMEWERKPNEKVTLICLDNLQYTTDEFLNEIKTYITEKRIRDCVIEASKLFSKNYGLNRFNNIVKVYGISQNPDSKDYIIVLQDWHCENCANWMNGPLQHDYYKWKRIPNIKVALKYLHNSQDITEEFLNEQIKPYDIVIDEDDFTCNPPKIYGISQNPNTKNYLLVLEYGNHCEKIPNREVALKCLYNSQNITNKILNKETEFYSIEIEWIPYNQLNEIKKVGKNDSAPLYSAIWTDGSLKYNYNKIEQKKISNKEVTLKYLVNSQNNITNEFLNKIKSYFVEYDNIIKIYGISQNPDTKKYIIVLENGKHCEICNEIYTDLSYKWCKLCQINNLKTNFINWTSSNEKIIELIQEMRLKIRNYDDIIVEWIPYNQFNDIKEIDKNNCNIIYSAIWMDGPLKYNQEEWKRIPNKKVALKCFYNSQNISNEFLNKVKSYSIKLKLDNKLTFTDNHNVMNFIVYSTKELERTRDIKVALKCLNNSQDISNGLLNEVKNYSICDNGILKIYGISQDPYTKDYIIVLQLADGNFVNYKYIKQSWYWSEKLYILNNIIDCLKIIHDNQMVHHDLHTGNILILPNIEYFAHSKSINKICISDMGLCREVSNISNTDETKVYGVMSYVAPEVLKGNPYTQAADIYSFALKICNGIRPEINEHEAPQCYIELMKKCWDTNPNNRPNATEIKEEINKQIEEAQNKKLRFSCIRSNQLTTHPKACYTSRLLNPFTKDLPKYDNINNNSVEVIDFTKLSSE